MEEKKSNITVELPLWCDLACTHASFPKEEAVDGSKSCRTFQALWCGKLKRYVPKNSPCLVVRNHN